MGECGCGEMNIIDSFFVGNKVVAIDFYRGCRECGADIGIKIHIFTKKEAKFWDIKPKESFKPDSFTGMNSKNLFWIGMSDFAEAISQCEVDLKEYDNIKDLFHDHDYDILQKAIEHQEAEQRKLKKG